MREFFTIDASAFPIVVGTYQNFIPTLEEFLKSQEDLETFIISHTDFVLLVDLSTAPLLSSEYRVSQTKWAAKNNPVFARQNIKLAFFTPSVLAQVAMKGSFFMHKPHVPYTLVSSFEKAKAWGLKQLKTK
jgi:hypothetical protein